MSSVPKISTSQVVGYGELVSGVTIGPLGAIVPNRMLVTVVPGPDMMLVSIVVLPCTVEVIIDCDTKVVGEDKIDRIVDSVVEGTRDRLIIVVKLSLMEVIGEAKLKSSVVVLILCGQS